MNLSVLADCYREWKLRINDCVGKGVREQSKEHMEHGRYGDADMCGHRQKCS